MEFKEAVLALFVWLTLMPQLMSQPSDLKDPTSYGCIEILMGAALIYGGKRALEPREDQWTKEVNAKSLYSEAG